MLFLNYQFSIQHISLHLEDDLSLETLSKGVGYTEYYLSRKFKQETGKSIGEFINQERIERSKTLLTTTTLLISNIATRLRYCSSSHFSKNFRKQTGLLPTQYRKENQPI